MPDQNIRQKIPSPQAPTLPEMVFVEGGAFRMGSDYRSEQPIHEVTVPDFHLGKYPVTNAQYAAFLNSYGSNSILEGENKGQKLVYEYKWGVQAVSGEWRPAAGFAQHPVVNVTWFGAEAYCRWLAGETKEGYGPPSEAMWEYAARGGVHWKDGFPYAGGHKLKEVGWYDENSAGQTMPVGLKLPNQLGLYDMSGNVFEWCADHWHENYEGAPKDGSPWIKGGDTARRVVRGGSWNDNDFDSRVSIRYRFSTALSNNSLGFRLARY